MFADLLQRGKPMGAGLSDKTAGSIIRYCLFLYQKVRKLREDVDETETIKRCVEQAIEPKEQMRGNDILL